MAKNEQWQQLVIKLKQRADNKHCADCLSQDSEWASTNLGIFVCIHCSGIHRSLGVHISKVRSLQLDEWDENLYNEMNNKGNIKSNSYWECNLLPFEKPMAHDPHCFRKKFINDKYVKKAFVPSDSNTTGKLEREFNTELLTKKSFLTKQGAKNKNWKKRWMVMNDNVLSYFKSKDDSYPAGSLTVTEDAMIMFVDENQVQKKFCFAIITTPRHYYIHAESEQDAIEWVYTLRMAVYYATLKKIFNDPRNFLKGSNGPVVEKNGILKKQGGKIKTMKKRFFLLKDANLSYYSSEKDLEPIDQISLLGSKVELNNKKKNEFGLNIITAGRQYYLTAATEKEQKEWFEAMKKVCETTNESQIIRQKSLQIHNLILNRMIHGKDKETPTSSQAISPHSPLMWKSLSFHRSRPAVVQQDPSTPSSPATPQPFDDKKRTATMMSNDVTLLRRANRSATELNSPKLLASPTPTTPVDQPMIKLSNVNAPAPEKPKEEVIVLRRATTMTPASPNLSNILPSPKPSPLLEAQVAQQVPSITLETKVELQQPKVETTPTAPPVVEEKKPEEKKSLIPTILRRPSTILRVNKPVEKVQPVVAPKKPKPVKKAQTDDDDDDDMDVMEQLTMSEVDLENNTKKKKKPTKQDSLPEVDSVLKKTVLLPKRKSTAKMMEDDEDIDILGDMIDEEMDNPMVPATPRKISKAKLAASPATKPSPDPTEVPNTSITSQLDDTDMTDENLLDEDVDMKPITLAKPAAPVPVDTETLDDTMEDVPKDDDEDISLDTLPPIKLKPATVVAQNDEEDDTKDVELVPTMTNAADDENNSDGEDGEITLAPVASNLPSDEPSNDAEEEDEDDGDLIMTNTFTIDETPEKVAARVRKERSMSKRVPRHKTSFRRMHALMETFLLGIGVEVE